MSRPLASTLALALAGLVLALALAVLASRLSTQHIGLAGEHGAPARGLVAPVARGRPATTTHAAPPAPRGHGEAGERRDD